VPEPVPPSVADSEQATVPPSSAVDAAETAERAPREGGQEPSPGTPPEFPTVAAYEILGVLGRGGMGVVYRARQVKAGRVVALKMILAGGHADDATLARFRTEAEAVARLQHPGIVQVFEVGEHDGLPFFSLEFCGGGSLADRLAGKPLPAGEAAALLEKLAEALHAAHLANVVHRDLKPANVLLTNDGTPKVTDFGLAKKLDEASQTQTGAVMGTPSYMAPEQGSGQPHAVGPQSDVYSLGAVLYECLTGRPPFLAATPLDTILQVLSAEPVPVRQLNAKVAVDLETICLKCLRKDPRQRYGSAAELAADLRRFRGGEPIVARPVGTLERGWRWCRRNPVVAGLLGAVAATLLLGTAVATVLAMRADAQARRADQEASNAQQQAALAKANEQTAVDERNKARAEEAKAKEQEELKARQLMTVQLMRVASGYERDPGQALALLHDFNACPIALRDTTWRFYERACSRWEVATFRGPSGGRCVAYSPDGQSLAVASQDGTVRLWDVQTGQERAPLTGHKSYVTSVGYSADGQSLASASGDGTVRLWDAATGRERAVLRGPATGVLSVAYSPDGLTLASGSEDGAVRLWDTATGKERATLAGRREKVWSVAFAPDGRTLAIASFGTVRLWEVKTGQDRTPLRDLTGAVHAVAFSPDGLTLATASSAFDVKQGAALPGEVRLWDVKTGQPRATLNVDTAEVESVAFSPDGRTLASGSGISPSSSEGKVWLWEVKTGQHRATLRGHTGAVTSVAFSPDGLTLASAAAEQTVRLWDVRPGQERAILRGHTASVHAVAFSPDGLTLASSAGDFADSPQKNAVPGDYTARLWDVQTGQERAPLKGHVDAVCSVAYSPDGLTLASGSDDKTVRLWDARTGRQRAVLNGHEGPVRAVAFSPDGALLASGSGDKTVRLWDAATGQPRATFQGHGASVTSVAFSPDGKTLASAADVVRLWDVKTGRERAPMNSSGTGILAVAFAPDGQTLAGSSYDQKVRLWDAKTGQQRAALTGHTGDVYSVAFSPDGKSLASASGGTWDYRQRQYVSGEVRLWDLQTSQQRALLKGHTAAVLSVAFSPDGKTLASASEDQTVRVWDVKPGQQRTTLEGHTTEVLSVAFSRDGLTLASAALAKTPKSPGDVRLWDVKTGQQRATLQGHTAGVLSVAFAPDGRTLAGGSPDKTVRLWDAETGQQRATLTGHVDAVTSVAFSPDGLTLASASRDQKVRLWDVRIGQELAVLRGHTAPVWSVAFSPDGQRVFGWDGGGNVRAWAVKDGQPTDAGTPPPRPSSSTVTNADGTRRAEARNNLVVLFDLKEFDEKWERAERLALEPINRLSYHQQQAAQAEREQDWFAAAFHLRQLRRERPDDADLNERHEQALFKLGRWDLMAAHLAEASQRSPDPELAFRLAVSQLSAGDEAGYRRTCQNLLSHNRPVAEGPFQFAARACLLTTEGAEMLEKILPLAEQPQPVLRGGALYRLKRYDEAAAVLQPVAEGGSRALFYLALTELRRGNREQAKRLLDQAVHFDPSNWPWEFHQEFELLRREVDGLITPPRMEKVPAP
jgi:WD40 repeat protein